MNVPHYTLAAVYDHESPTHYFNRALVHVAENDQCHRRLHKITRSAPSNPAALLSRGTEYRERKLPGDPVRAVDDLTQAISLDDTIANGYYARGPAYFEVGEDFYIDAFAGLLHAHEFRPDDPDSNRAVCWLLVVTEQADSAIPYCNVAVDSGVDDGYFTRGTACLKINDSTALPKAVSDCTEAVRKDPFSLKAFMNRGSAYFKLGEVHYDQSIADL